MNYYISDLHFGHKNILSYDERPFYNVNDMEQELVKNWNGVVSENDTVYILGDFCWSKDESEWIRILGLLNGIKVLIKGNHDLKQMSAKLKNKFSDIKDYKEITDGEHKVIMSHYPIPFYKHSYDKHTIMLCGHVHETKEDVLLNLLKKTIKDSKNGDYDALGQIVNVGCMKKYIKYTPQTLEYLLEYA